VRDAKATRARILESVGTLLAREGFGALGVNAVAREANVDKVLIYRYFGGLDELLTEYAGTRAFWPDIEELIGGPLGSMKGLSRGEAFARVMKNYLHALKDRPLTLEILAWENASPGPLSEALARVREQRGKELLEAGIRMASPEEDFAALLALLVTGITGLLMKARSGATMKTLPLQEEESWGRVEGIIDRICTSLVKD
jgi:AcrR family transcriptional regulator